MRFHRGEGNIEMGVNRRTIYFMLFAVSGFSGLIYESIWTHYLKLFLGHAAYAQTLVLAIFMGGMALGSWICSRYSSRWKNLLLSYAVTEGSIGLFALVFHHAFAYTTELAYTSILPQLGGPWIVTAFKWTFSALMILPQSILLGMTFPMMSAGILRLFPEKPGRSVAMLYFVNSLGAAIGVLVSGFILIGLTGLPGTIRIAGLINVILALTVWLLVRKSRPSEKRSEARQKQASAVPNAGRYWFFLLASLVTGTASFIYEMGWIRMLSLVLGSSTHAFELMLSAFIFGLAFGGLWIQRRIDRVVRPVRYLAHVQVIMGLLALSTLLSYGNTFEVMRWIIQTLSKTEAGYTYFTLSSNAIALGIMLPATFCAGMTLPLITFVLIREGYGERSIGAVYAANTVGAILGVFFAIQLGMPLVGVKGLMIVGASLDIALGLTLFWRPGAEAAGRWKPALITAMCLFAVAGTLLFVKLDPYQMASGVYRFGHILSRGRDRVVYHKDGKTATVSLVRDSSGTMAVRTNGKPDSGIMMEQGKEPCRDEPTMILAAVIPMALTPHASTAAVIGLGTGLTSQTLLGNPMLREVDTVEIEEGMVEAARHFRPRVERVYTDPRSKIYIDDAKTFFSTFNRKYDLIVSEPSNPWVSGVAGLFSGEFYRLIRRHLNENGLFVQWLQLYEINVELVVSVLKALSQNFSDFGIYASSDNDLLIIARGKGVLPDLNVNVLKIPEIADALKRIHLKGAQDIEIRKIGTKKFFARFLESLPIRENSDYDPVLDQNAERTRFLGNTAKDLIVFTHIPLPALEMLTGSVLPSKETSIVASPIFPRSMVAFVAMALRDYFLTGKFVSQYADIPEDIRQNAIRLRELFHECDPKSKRPEGLEILLDVSTMMIPYLHPTELDAVWKKLESEPCGAKLSAQERQWVTLFKAVSNRDAPRITSAVRTLLEGADHLPPGPLRYLVASGMLGYLVEGNRAESDRLWLKYRAAMFGKSEPNMLFRFLAAESIAHGPGVASP